MAPKKYKAKRQLRSMPGNVTVFEAEQTELSRKVELRVLNQFVGPDSDTYLRFEREFKTIARLDHPNVVKVYDWGLADDKIYYVAERREAAPVEEFLTKGPKLELTECLQIGVQIADALAYLHEQSLVHRDIGTESIYYAPDKKLAYIAHFNMVKNLRLEDLTAKGVAQVAPLAFTPERMKDQEVDHRTDIFMLGAMLYRMLAGEDPLPREAMLMNPNAEISIKKPSEASPALDARYDGPLMTALALDPAERFQKASAFKAELEKLAERSAVKPARPGSTRSQAVSRTPAPPAAAPAAPVPAPRAPKGAELPSTDVVPGARPAAAPGPLHAMGLGSVVDRYGPGAAWSLVGSTLLLALLLVYLLLS